MDFDAMSGAMERAVRHRAENEPFNIQLMARYPHKFSIGEIQQSFSRVVDENVRQQSLLRSALPEIMAHMSEDLYSAAWLIGLDRELPKISQLVHNIACIIGEIPTNYNPPEWRIYPDECDFKKNEN
jgi:hypothetical protein